MAASQLMIYSKELPEEMVSSLLLRHIVSLGISERLSMSSAAETLSSSGG